MKAEESMHERYMRLLCEKTRELGREVTFAEVAEDPKLPPPNNYSFYAGSFDNAAEQAWMTVRAQLRKAQALSSVAEGEVSFVSPTVKAKVGLATPTARAKVILTAPAASLVSPAAKIKANLAAPTVIASGKTQTMPYDEVLERALAVCEELQRVPRQSGAWRAKTNFREMVQVLGRGDFMRAVRVVQDAWDERHPELKRASNDILSAEELEWTKEDWLKWLLSLGRRDYESVSFWGEVSRQHTLQYRRILYVFGNWPQAIAELEEFLKTGVGCGADG